ncbi:lysozyme inhibitor LprI family protein [Pseudoduganella sp. OTU4001]|uniref:lysozyme inhibitor LprI family protein n=1 Tax=Pseudoduganella sp. OTU4001 TaxID=3043854 RepID=UPI00313DB12C
MRWLAFVVSAALAGSALAGPAAWPLSYQGASTNRFIWDKRTRALVQRTVPAALAGDVLDGLGGPPDPVQVEGGRYFVASACVAHMCDVKGMYWYDIQRGAGLGASYDGSTLWLGSNNLQAASLPAAARHAVRNWLADQGLQPSAVWFVAKEGKQTALAREQFVPPMRFEPPPGGPSFDCAQAVTRTEQVICTTPGLAQRDLELAQLVREMRHGVATAGAQQQLRDLQRSWLKQRDVECAAAVGIATCLEGQYAAQLQRLRNWLPR